MPLKPIMTGRWDGHSLWMQWSPAGEGVSYDVQIRHRATPEVEWSAWQQSIPKQGVKADWGVIPVWKPHFEFQSRVRIAGTDDWEMAEEAEFLRCLAEFEVSTAESNFIAEKGTKIAAVVDGAACTYTFLDDVSLQRGESARFTLASLGTSGYYQLDYPGHFDVRPLLGVRIFNTGPSYDDVIRTGSDITTIQPLPLHEFTVAFTRPKTL